jgi:hypothetical protein
MFLIQKGIVHGTNAVRIVQLAVCTQLARKECNLAVCPEGWLIEHNVLHVLLQSLCSCSAGCCSNIFCIGLGSDHHVCNGTAAAATAAGSDCPENRVILWLLWQRTIEVVCVHIYLSQLVRNTVFFA